MKTKKILLIRPDLKTSFPLSLPLGIISIGTYLVDNGYEVKIIDFMAGDNHNKIIEKEIQDYLFIGVSVMTAHIPSALDISKFVKSINKNSLVVWGGVHPTLYPRQTISNAYIDIAIPGDGEYVCLDLAESLYNGRDINSVKGIIYKDNNHKIIYTNGQNKPVDINTLPFLNYNIIDLNKYIIRNIDPTFTHSYKSKNERYLSVIGSLGCKFRCSFCVNPVIHNRIQRIKSATRLLDEIEYFVYRYNVRYFYIRDEDFFGDKNRLLEFLSGIKKRKLEFKWSTNGRCTYFNDNYINSNMLEQMEHLGLYLLGIGAESGSQKVLDILKKDIRVNNIEYVAYITKDTNITVSFSFMIGIPDEELEDVYKTIKLIRKLKKINPKCFIIGPQLYRPYPGAELFDICIKKGFSQPEDLNDWRLILDRYSGYLSPRNLPWLNSSRSFNLIYFYSRIMFKYVKTLTRDAYFIIRVLLLFILKFIAEIRLRFNFWGAPFEIVIYNIFIKVSNLLKSTVRLNKNLILF